MAISPQSLIVGSTISCLPACITMDCCEFCCYIIKGVPKLKLYADEDGHLKGDGLCCYLKVMQLGEGLEIM